MKILWKTIKSIFHVLAIFLISAMLGLVMNTKMTMVIYLFALMDIVWFVVFLSSIAAMLWENSIDFLRGRKIKRIKFKAELKKTKNKVNKASDKEEDVKAVTNESDKL